MTSRRLGLVLLTAGIAGLVGCAPALREPSPLPTPESLRTEPGVPEDAALRAGELWALRDPVSVRQAAVGFERRVALGRARFDSLVAAVRAWNWLAARAPEEADRREAAARAVRAAQWCPEIAPEAPECAFWLGAALGAQARERRATALDALPRIVDLFEQARRSIPDYELAGPDRALAVLLARAPGFPVGPGDPELAVEHARAAVARFPDHAPNQAALGEALEAMDLDGEARRAWERAAALAETAIEEGDPSGREWLRDARDALGRLPAADGAPR